MRVIVTGGRDKTSREDREMVFRGLDYYHNTIGITLVIEGGEKRGIDHWAEQWADSRDVHHVKEEADWNNIDAPGAVVRSRTFGSVTKEYNAKAGPDRNQRMIDDYNPDACIHFPGGDGTHNMIELSIKAGLTIYDGVDLE